jgi:dTDP-glucose 4,6-dehydratase
MVLRKGKIGETYHISTKKIISIKNLVTKILKKEKINFNDLINDTKDRKGKDHSYKLDSRKLRKLGWHDKTSLDRGIYLTFDWIIKNFKYLKNKSLEYKHKK